MTICPQCHGIGGEHWSACTLAPLKPWERDLLRRPHQIGEGEVTFTRTDGRKVTFDNVDYDSIGPMASNPGVVTFHYFGKEDKMVHLPFVEFWTVSFRL